MSFRDDRDAMRARIEELERELARSTERLEKLEDAEAEVLRLRAQVGLLEAELAELRESPEQRGRRAEAAKRARKAAEAEAQREREATKEKTEAADDEGTLWSKLTWPRMLGAAAGVTVVGFFGYAQCAPPTWTASHAVPSLGLVDLYTTPHPAPIQGVAAGSRPSPMGCAGYLPDAPQIVVRTQEPTLVSFAVRSSGDTVLVVLDADGTVHCDDDSGGGTDPAVSASLTAGEHRVWVGTYTGEQSDPFTLTLAARSAPDGPIDSRGLSPTSRPVHGEQRLAAEEARFVGTVPTSVSTSAFDARCRGFVDAVPTVVVVVDEWSYVRFEAASDTDLVLLVEGPGGALRCDDDSGSGNTPLIADLLEPGRYRVWVGTYSAQSMPAPYSLAIAGSSQSAVVDPPPRALSPGDVVRIERGPMVALDATCGGLVPGAPSAILDLASNLDVELTAERAGIVLRTEGPQGTRCLGTGTSTWLAGRHRTFTLTETDSGGPVDVTLLAHPPSILPYGATP